MTSSSAPGEEIPRNSTDPHSPLHETGSDKRRIAFFSVYVRVSTGAPSFPIRKCERVSIPTRSKCAKLPRRTFNRSLQCAYPCAVSSSCSGGPGPDAIASGIADDFDRDYFDELKRDYASPTVRIYGRDDYELDPHLTAWLMENRGRDAKEIARASAARPVPDGMAFAPLRLTDLHDAEETDSFVERAAEYDPISGRVWNDPPPDMHLVEERDFSDLRHDPDDVADGDGSESAAHPDPGSELAFEPLRRVQLTEEEEIAALRDACERMQLAEFERPANFVSTHEQFAQPSPDEFARWTEAAERRGGNASEHDSYELPPVAPAPRVAGDDNAANGGAGKPHLTDVPNQFLCLARAHGGQWRGTVDVTALSWNDGNVQCSQLGSSHIESLIGIFSDIDALTWSSTVSGMHDPDVTHVSSLTFAVAKGAEDLSPERAVFDTGAFISQRREETNCSTPPLSLTAASISFLTDAEVEGAVELCMISGTGENKVRSRFVLCTMKECDEAKRPRKANRSSTTEFSHLITIRESRLGASCNHEASSPFSPELLYGCWRGTGTSLHPFYPPVPATSVASEQRCWEASGIQPADVSWTEEDFSKMRDESKQISVYTSGSKNQKRSKRVSAAAKHDMRRLAPCTFLCSNKVGDCRETTHAWGLEWQRAPDRILSSPWQVHR